MFETTHLRGAGARLTFFVVVLAGLICIRGKAAWAQIAPAAYAGVLTRWQTSDSTACTGATVNGSPVYTSPCSVQNAFYTPTPNLFGVSLTDWYNNLKAQGVNMGVIYVVLPGGELSTTQSISTTDWDNYNSDIYIPPASLTTTEENEIFTVQPTISSTSRPLNFTTAQRDYAIIQFLQELQSAFPAYSRTNPPPIQFILDEREWFIGGFDSNNEPIPLTLSQVFSLEQTYASDIAGIVNQAVSDGLDQWLGGVRISEYASKDWNLMGPVMIDLATLINQQTQSTNYPNGWLTKNTFIGAGAGWGQQWNGVNNMQCPTTTGWQFSCTGALPFFQLMQPQAAYFAFGDKFMEFGKGNFIENGSYTGTMYQYINGEAAVYCQYNTCADPSNPTVADWTNFLSDDVNGLGFSDLISFLQANAATYPNLANVIFEGDNSDSFNTMLRTSTSLGAEDWYGAEALTNMFTNAVNDKDPYGNSVGNIGKWTGKLFLDGYNDTSASTSKYLSDSGQSMFGTSYDDFTFSPTSQTITEWGDTVSAWVHWPDITTLTALENTSTLSQAATPAFSPASGTYGSGQSVTISDSTPNATIYYTTDGSTPTINSTKYAGAITVSSSETINAIATASGYSQSAAASATYTISGADIYIGDQTIESTADGGHANHIEAFKETLSQTATIQSLSIYLSTAQGQMYLGIYTDASGYPGTLEATTAEFKPTTGWNTVNVQTPVSLPAGTYWIVFLPQSTSAVFQSNGGVSGTEEIVHYSIAALPSTFPSGGTASTNTDSFYGTLTTP